ncbi:MAG TPA: Stp1/IreP family PP2C-type Ser/Thr phosphatase [Bacillota bacterium]|nr:Stp1/IreP family PP2C-type Ser/Thr phosphatase [Bacillota bacterium]
MEYDAYSHKGTQRKSNQDYYYMPGAEYSKYGYIMVADGMGGHNAGDLASRLTVEYVSKYLHKKYTDKVDKKTLMGIIYKSIEGANKRIYALSKEEDHLDGMGTTLTLAAFIDNTVYIAHVGDSRCYLIRDKKVKQITRDHSLVQELVDNGSITPDQMIGHPKKNVITRALGTEDKIRIDVFEEKLDIGDTILLCTDGLVNYVNLDDFIGSTPGDLSLDVLVNTLGDKALDAGGRDDITIVAARYTCHDKER